MGLIHLGSSFATPRPGRAGARRPGGGSGRLPVRRLAGAPDRRDRRERQIQAAYEGTDALLLGRRTYDIFAPPTGRTRRAAPTTIATLFNSILKYVASRSKPDLPWDGSTQLVLTWPTRCASPRAAREHQGGRKPGPRAEPAARAALRPHRPLAAPHRARRRQEGVRGRRGAHQRHAARPPGRQPPGRRTCATGSPTASPPPAT